MYDLLLPRFFRRLFARPLAEANEMEAFGARGEEVVYRKLRETFECVIRNPVIPNREGYMEKDFLVIHAGVPVVIEVKNWKGRISASATGNRFIQDKADGTHKDLKSPIGTTRRFLAGMMDFYGLDTEPMGMVVFADPECTLDLPPQMSDVSLVEGDKMIAEVKRLIKISPAPTVPLDPVRVLHCVRLYTKNGRSFSKGVAVDNKLLCFTTKGEKVSLNPVYVRYISLDHQPLLLRDRMTVTFTNGSSATFYNHSTALTILCLDGTAIRVPLSKISTIVF